LVPVIPDHHKKAAFSASVVGPDREVLSSVDPPTLTDRHFRLLFQELEREVRC
jgi:hypothetical protein